MVIYGQPVRTAGRDLQFYLLFPLTAEQRTLGLVQSTLMVEGLVLILLLVAVTNVVTRQVVRPVQQAADIAERFAAGHLEERMPVKGDDEVARLAESYNEMAGSIQSQIRQLEEFGALQRRFTSDVSHELRTPLTTVRMAADVLFASREELPAALRRSSELLVEELDRFEALLADLLEISRLDAGMAELGRRAHRYGTVSLRARGRRGARAGWRRAGRELEPHVAHRGVRGGGQPAGGAHRAQPGGQRDRPRRGPAGVDPAGQRRACGRGAGRGTGGWGCVPVRPGWCSTGSGGPTRLASGAAGAPDSAFPSAWRTPGCTTAGCRPGASGAGVPRVPADAAEERWAPIELDVQLKLPLVAHRDEPLDSAEAAPGPRPVDPVEFQAEFYAAGTELRHTDDGGSPRVDDIDQLPIVLPVSGDQRQSRPSRSAALLVSLLLGAALLAGCASVPDSSPVEPLRKITEGYGATQPTGTGGECQLRWIW